MKKIRIVSIMLVLLLMINVACYAAIDPTLHFDVSYEGTIKVNEEKETLIVLEGENTPLHTNVRVKVDVEGPATPKLLATDSAGTEYDIAQIGYWGPPSGFAIQGTFKNETPVRSTAPEAGTYTITLSLLDVQNGNDILAQKTYTFQVQPENDSATNEIANEIMNETINEIVESPVEELPKTGTSLIEYAIYAVIVLAIIYLAYQIRERRK